MNDYASTAAVHAACGVCGAVAGLGLRFTPNADGTVTARFQPGEAQQGYPGLVHGGVLCTLVDAAMTHCLFARGIHALTAELTVRFVAPARLAAALDIHAAILERRRRSTRLSASIEQDGQIVARATATFLDPKPRCAPDPHEPGGDTTDLRPGDDG